jgi:hypothetical protein
LELYVLNVGYGFDETFQPLGNYKFGGDFPADIMCDLCGDLFTNASQPKF